MLLHVTEYSEAVQYYRIIAFTERLLLRTSRAQQGHVRWSV